MYLSTGHPTLPVRNSPNLLNHNKKAAVSNTEHFEAVTLILPYLDKK